MKTREGIYLSAFQQRAFAYFEVTLVA